jgi:hypothetical protein
MEPAGSGALVASLGSRVPSLFRHGHEQLVQAVAERRIRLGEEGRYPEGSALPGQTLLVYTYNVTRMTARQASKSSRPRAWSAASTAAGRSSGSGPRSADSRATALAAPTARPARAPTTWRCDSSASSHAQLATSYIPWSLAEGTQMAEPDSGPGGSYSRLADIGHGPVHSPRT